MDGARRLAAQALPIAVIFAWGVMMGSFAFRTLISSQSSPVSNVTAGQTVERVSRGEPYYVRPWEAALADISLSGAVVFGFAAVLTMHFLFGKESLATFRWWQYAAGLNGAAAFWAICLTFHP